eukprot:318545-Rhodomonas_salina.2
MIFRSTIVSRVDSHLPVAWGLCLGIATIGTRTGITGYEYPTVPGHPKAPGFPVPGTRGTGTRVPGFRYTVYPGGFTNLNINNNITGTHELGPRGQSQRSPYPSTRELPRTLGTATLYSDPGARSTPGNQRSAIRLHSTCSYSA